MTNQQLIDFVVAEARMLDELRFDDWLNLFTEDGVELWMDWDHDKAPQTRALKRQMADLPPALFVDVHAWEGDTAILAPHSEGPARARMASSVISRSAGIRCSMPAARSRATAAWARTPRNAKQRKRKSRG